MTPCPVMMAPMARLGLMISLIMFSLPTPSLAQVVTTMTPDGSLGTTVSQNGSAHTIDGGTIRGPNQFHSFDRFDVGTGDTARFTGPAGVENILSRVTGGAVSTIDGTLQSDIAGANLFLLNPSGVLFGPHASLQVEGSFHASTANLIRLRDGNQFVADLSNQSALSVAAPVAFGFLEASPSGMRMDGSRLEVPAGQMLNLVGGHIDIVGDGGGGLIAPGGEIRLTSIKSPREVVFRFDGESPRIGLERTVGDGDITLSSSAFLEASGATGGTIDINGGQILLEGGSFLRVNTEAEEGGISGGIVVDATGTLRLIEESFMTTNTFGNSAAGDLAITAENIVISEGSFIASNTLSAGPSGDVTVRVADTLSIIGNPENDLPNAIITQATLASSGAAGEIIVEARALTLLDGGAIGRLAFGSGGAGDLTVRVSDRLTIMGSNVNNASGIVALVGAVSSAAGDLSIG